MLREKKAKQLDEWLELCKKSKLKYIRDFAKGIEQEKSAVFAAFSMSWSNGQAEGQINRLKLLKR